MPLTACIVEVITTSYNLELINSVLVLVPHHTLKIRTLGNAMIVLLTVINATLPCHNVILVLLDIV